MPLPATSALKLYQELTPGVFRWLETLPHSVNDVASISIGRDVRRIAPDPSGWQRWEPLPDYHVTLIFTDETVGMKTFTPEQLRGEQP